MNRLRYPTTSGKLQESSRDHLRSSSQLKRKSRAFHSPAIALLLLFGMLLKDERAIRQTSHLLSSEAAATVAEHRSAQVLEMVRTWSRIGDLWLSLAEEPNQSMACLRKAYRILSWARLHGIPTEKMKGDFENAAGHISFASHRLGIFELRRQYTSSAINAFTLSLCASRFAYSYLGMSLALLENGKIRESRSFFLYSKRLRPSVIRAVPHSFRSGLLISFDKIPNFQSAPHPGKKLCHGLASTLQFSNFTKRNFGVVYAHRPGKKSYRRMPEGVFMHEVSMISYGMTSLGYDVVQGSLEDCLEGMGAYFRGCMHRQLIVFGAVHLSLGQELEKKVPKRTVLVQSEQIGAEMPFATAEYFSLLRSPKYRVWDYSRSNKKSLASQHGIHDVKLLPYGYVPQLSMSISAAYQKDIDVLLFGSLHSRRLSILQKLGAMGYHCAFLEGLYGSDRDFVISRAKIALNIHYYNTNITETNRLYLASMANLLIISEHGQDEAEDAPWALGGVVFVAYTEVIETVSYYMSNPKERNQKIAQMVPAMLRWPFYPQLQAHASEFDKECVENGGQTEIQELGCNTWRENGEWLSLRKAP